jgi:hypothetical protein
MKSVIRYSKATQGSAAQYEQFVGREEAGVKTLEQMRDVSGAGAKAVMARFMPSGRVTPEMNVPTKPSFPQPPKAKYPLPGKSSVLTKLGFKRH